MLIQHRKAQGRVDERVFKPRKTEMDNEDRKFFIALEKPICSAFIYILEMYDFNSN